ncbi:MAG: ABC transporter permease [Methylococcales bacterium]|nr:ABC transporter permease [Methylococcales bacterium]
MHFYLDRLTLALYALRDNRLRTVLSILGISLGIAAVMAVGTISKGGNYLVFSELETFGLNSVWVYRDRQDKDPHRKVREGTGIDNDDYQAIVSHCCKAVNRMSPFVRGREKLIIQTVNQYSNADVKGVGKDFTLINNDTLIKGRSFRLKDITSNRAVAILGPTAVTDLFGETGSPIGKEFRIGLRKLLVIGVLKAKSRDFLASIGSSGEDANNRILIPYTFYQKILGNKAINQIRAEAISLDKAESAARQLIVMLRRGNDKHFEYGYETMTSYIKTTDNILNGVSIIGIVAASISLLVGGMGIMNIMSTSVLERTREIGLRKAVGARYSDIMLQFLMEATIISTLGGLIGLILGSGSSILLAKLTGFPLIPSLTSIMIAFVVSVGMGIVSGYWPAKRAASLHPVEALRYE